MDSKLILLALAAFVCAVSAKSAVKNVDEILLGEDKDFPELDGDAVDSEEAESSESSEEVEESVEVSSGEAETVNPCVDISGVFASSVSDARLVIVQEVEGTVSGLFRNSSQSAWYEFEGIRGSSENSAFGLVAIRDEVRAVTVVSGVCNACDGTLDLSLMTSFSTGECQSLAIPMPNYVYNRSGSAEQAREVVEAFRSVEEGSGSLE